MFPSPVTLTDILGVPGVTDDGGICGAVHVNVSDSLVQLTNSHCLELCGAETIITDPRGNRAQLTLSAAAARRAQRSERWTQLDRRFFPVFCNTIQGLETAELTREGNANLQSEI